MFSPNSRGIFILNTQTDKVIKNLYYVLPMNSTKEFYFFTNKKNQCAMEKSQLVK
jgi:hypothetical protein